MAAFTDWGAPLRIDRRYDTARHDQHDQGIASRRIAITIVCDFVCGMSRSTASVAKSVSIARSWLPVISSQRLLTCQSDDPEGCDCMFDDFWQLFAIP